MIRCLKTGALALVVFTLIAACGGDDAPQPERATGSTTGTEGPDPQAAQTAVLELADLPKGFGWAEDEGEDDVFSKAVDELLVGAEGRCLPAGRRSDFVESRSEEFEQGELDGEFVPRVSNVVFAYRSTSMARSVVARFNPERFAECFEAEANRAFDTALRDHRRDANGVTPEALTVSFSFEQQDSAYFPHEFGEESAVLAFKLTASIEGEEIVSGRIEMAVLRQGPLISLVSFETPVLDQQQEILNIVASKMGDRSPAPITAPGTNEDAGD